MKTPGFGDRVRILATPATTSVGLANKAGTVYGITTPSTTGVEVLGPGAEDSASQIHIDGDGRQIWFPIEALEFLDHSPGLTVRTGKRNLIRGRNGRWRDFKPN